jgi:hypothetical protein
LKTPIFKRDDWLANKVSIQVEVVQRRKTEGKRGSQAAAVQQHYNICQESINERKWRYLAKRETGRRDYFAKGM